MSDIGKIDMTVPAWTRAGDHTKPLTVKELQLMHLLKDKPAGIEKIMSTLWGPKNSRLVSNKTLHVHIHNLRKKLAEVGITIIYEDLKYSLVQLKTKKKRV